MRGDRIVVIRGPADFAAINQMRQRNLRSEIVGEDGPVLLLSGPASREGGQFMGLWAAAIVAQVYPRLRVIAPYDSKERRRLVRFVEQIQMASMLICPDDRLTWPELVTCADAFVTPAVKETCTEPLSVAMAGGLVVVGSAVRSVAEIVADRHNGLLCKPGKPKLLAARILTALEDAALIKQVTDTARGQAYDVFSVRAFVENYLHVYENLVGGKPLDQSVSDRAMIA